MNDKNYERWQQQRHKHMRQMGLPVWVVYDHPKDYPNNYVARQWRGEQVTESFMVCPDLELLRGQLIDMGLVKLLPMEGDDPVILEVWL